MEIYRCHGALFKTAVTVHTITQSCIHAFTQWSIHALTHPRIHASTHSHIHAITHSCNHAMQSRYRAITQLHNRAITQSRNHSIIKSRNHTIAQTGNCAKVKRSVKMLSIAYYIAPIFTGCPASFYILISDFCNVAPLSPDWWYEWKIVHIFWVF